MAKLNKIAKLMKNAKQNDIADKFIQDLEYTIEKRNTGGYTPTQTYSPSSMGGCMRAMYYKMINIPIDTSKDMNLCGICESGTDRHEILQDYIQIMNKYGIDCEWIDVAKYLKDNNITDPEVISQQGNETKLFSKKYNMRFLCDGLVKYRGEYFIIEIKTESTFKYGKHDEPFIPHKKQATCYSMTIGVSNVIFIYEDRDNCNKKGYLVNVTPKMMEGVENIINYVDDCVEKGTIPPRETDKCMYCNYRDKCGRDGE